MENQYEYKVTQELKSQKNFGLQYLFMQAIWYSSWVFCF